MSPRRGRAWHPDDGEQRQHGGRHEGGKSTVAHELQPALSLRGFGPEVPVARGVARPVDNFRRESRSQSLAAKSGCGSGLYGATAPSRLPWGLRARAWRPQTGRATVPGNGGLDVGRGPRPLLQTATVVSDLAFAARPAWLVGVG
jgi:hypothetical protein